MDGPATAAFERWITDQEFQPLAILTTTDVQRLPRLVASLQARYEFPVVSVGRELGDALLAVRPDRRLREAERWLQHTCRQAEQHPLILTDLDLLFHPRLEPGTQGRLDPLALFKGASRIAPIAVLWPGGFDGVTLTYAQPDHDHYASWRQPPAVAIACG